MIPACPAPREPGRPRIPLPPGSCDTHDLFQQWTPDDASRRRILVANPARLYGFAG
jgi:predicted TIM-barrel fold metal-dependent hydrolase